MKNQNIYLIGFMGAGKSTISAYLCRNYNRKQIEMDEQIEKEQGMTISEIFEKFGEERFRELETELLKRVSEKEGMVVSCGGGTAMRECNVEIMKKGGKIVWLGVTPETVYGRVRYSHNRPLLEGNMNVEYIRGLMEKRLPKYEAAADFCVQTDGKSTKDICREIIENLDRA